MRVRGDWKPACARCRVDRHDRCVGRLDCGCDHPSHQHQEETETMTPDQTQAVTAATNMDVAGALTATDEEAVIVGMHVELYEQLAEAARLQDREPDVVLKRALTHYFDCSRGRCPHAHDEVPSAAVEPPPARS